VSDLGCATGLYLAPFLLTSGIKGYDFSRSAFDDEVRMVDKSNLQLADLRDPLFDPPKTEISLCFEVVEHIGSEYAEILMDNIAKTSNIVIMTSCPPGQAGLNHVNCQPQEYWQKKFEARGYHRDYHDEYQLVFAVSLVPHTVWMIRNLMVFKR